MYEDIKSGTGLITDIGLWYNGNAGAECTNYLNQHPAGLVPEGQPAMNSPDQWMYFVWNRFSIG